MPGTPLVLALVLGQVLAAASARPANGQVAPRDTARPGVSVRLDYAAGTRPGIAVLPVAGVAGDSVRAILQRDLDFGDRVTVLGGAAADAPLTAAGSVSYDVARRLGAAGLVRAVVQPTGVLRVQLHDVAQRKVLATRDFPLPAPVLSPAWRLAVHGASDEVERWATGVRGVAATRVLFVRDRRVWIIDSDGENARPVTDRGALSPDWHPSGSAFVHATLSDRGTMQIVARQLATGAARVLAGAPVTNITPVVSPDGGTVLFAHGEEAGVDLFAVPFTGGAVRRVTVGRGTDNTSPSFSPDGRRITFTSGRLGHPEVYIVDADGSNADLLTPYEFGEQSYRSNPDWSPDGRLVAFQSMNRGGQFQVMTIGLRDRQMRQLTTEGRNEDPTWAPDSRHLVVSSTRTGAQQLFVVDVETGRSRQLTTGSGGARMAAWSPVLTSP